MTNFIKLSYFLISAIHFACYEVIEAQHYCPSNCPRATTHDVDLVTQKQMPMPLNAKYWPRPQFTYLSPTWLLKTFRALPLPDFGLMRNKIGFSQLVFRSKSLCSCCVSLGHTSAIGVVLLNNEEIAWCHTDTVFESPICKSTNWKHVLHVMFAPLK